MSSGMIAAAPSLGGIFSPVSRTLSGIGSFNRHVLDSDIAFGRPGERWNVRDAYRTEYKPEQRIGGSLGDVAGAAIPLAGLNFWRQKGFHVPGLTGGWKLMAARGTGIAAATAMALPSGRKVLFNAQDEGNYKLPGIAIGGAGGAMLGAKLTGGRPLLGTALGFGLGAAGAGFAGSRIEAGDGTPQRGPIPSQAKDHQGVLGNTVDFSRGAWNHFVESGPFSQGISFGYKWGQRESFQKDYDRSEQAGGMVGDLSAAVVLGAGALSVGKRVLAGANPTAAGVIAAPLTQLGLSAVERSATRLPHARQGMTAVAVGGGALALKYLHDRAEETAGGLSGGEAVVAGAGAIGAGAVAATRMPFIRSLPANTRTAASVASSMLLLGVVSAARTPVQNFARDTQDVWRQRGDGPILPTAVALGAAGAAPGAMAGAKIGKMFGAGGWKKALAVGAGGVVGAAAGASFAPVMPWIAKKPQA